MPWNTSGTLWATLSISQVLKADFKDSAAFTQGRTLLQTFILLKALLEWVCKACQSKLQWVQTAVTSLGHEVSQAIQKLSPQCLEWLLPIPLPTMKKQLQTFLVAAAYCHQGVLTLFSLLNPRAHSLALRGFNLLWSLTALIEPTPLARSLPHSDKPFFSTAMKILGLLQAF